MGLGGAPTVHTSSEGWIFSQMTNSIILRFTPDVSHAVILTTLSTCL
jgi:hypothetical protein